MYGFSSLLSLNATKSYPLGPHKPKLKPFNTIKLCSCILVIVPSDSVFPHAAQHHGADEWNSAKLQNYRPPNVNLSNASWQLSDDFRSKASALFIILFKHSIPSHMLAFCATFKASLLIFLLYFFFSLMPNLTAQFNLKRWKEIILSHGGDKWIKRNCQKIRPTIKISDIDGSWTDLLDTSNEMNEWMNGIKRKEMPLLLLL